MTMAQGKSTSPLTPSEKALAAASDLLSARQRNSSSSMSLSAAGESHTSKFVELPGFKDNYRLGKGFDGNRRGHYYNVVALDQQEVDKASRKKPSQPRYSKKWSVGADLHLKLIDEHLRVLLYSR